jgi:hypothetical protein
MIMRGEELREWLQNKVCIGLMRAMRRLFDKRSYMNTIFEWP